MDWRILRRESSFVVCLWVVMCCAVPVYSGRLFLNEVGTPVMGNWKAKDSDQWMIPVGGGIGKIIRVGKQPVNVSTQFFYNVETPGEGPDWSARFVLQFLFPK